MSWNEDDDEDARREAIDERRARNSMRCQCDDANMPGRCPGPANCPLVGCDDEDAE